MAPTESRARTTSATGSAKISRNAGFTLLEVLLVVVILLITSALAVPSFIRSFRGAKLRTAARAVVMSHRYARAMAVLKQTDAAILYDSKKGSIEIISVKSSDAAARNKFLDNRAGAETARSGDAASKQGEAADAIVSELTRLMPEGIWIERLESNHVQREKDGLYWVMYYANGMCDDYTLRLMDGRQKHAVIKVDPISGKASVIYE